MKIENLNQHDLDLSGLISRLKGEDNRNSRLTNWFQWIMFILALLYFAIFVIDFSEEGWQESRGMLFFAMSFFGFAISFRMSNRQLRSVDYGIPTVEMLTKTVKRYQFWQRKSVLSLLLVVLVNIGISLLSYFHLLPFSSDAVARILITSAVFIPLIAGSVTIGYFIWSYRQKPIRDKALALLNEITGE